MAAAEWIVVVVEDDACHEILSVATQTEAMEIAAAMRERGTRVDVEKRPES